MLNSNIKAINTKSFKMQHSDRASAISFWIQMIGLLPLEFTSVKNSLKVD